MSRVMSISRPCGTKLRLHGLVISGRPFGTRLRNRDSPRKGPLNACLIIRAPPLGYTDFQYKTLFPWSPLLTFLRYLAVLSLLFAHNILARADSLSELSDSF